METCRRACRYARRAADSCVGTHMSGRVDVNRLSMGISSPAYGDVGEVFLGLTESGLYILGDRYVNVDNASGIAMLP